MVLLADEIGRPAARVQSRRKLAFSLIRMGQVDEAQAVLEAAETLARASGDALEEARVTLARGSLALHRSRSEEALAFLARSRQLARQVGNRRIEAQIIGTMGIAYLELRRLDEAQEHSELSLSLMQAEGDKAGEMIAIGNVAAVLLEGERYEEALSLLERHLALARESGMRLGETYATANLGLLFSALGRVEGALAFIERSLRLSREFGHRIPEIENLERLGTALAMLGRYEEARPHCERSLAIAREIQNSRLEGSALIGLGGIAESSGDLGTAEDFYRQAEGAWNAIRATSDLPHVFLRLGGLFRISGRIEEARANLHQAVARARESRSLKVEVLALAHLALLPGGDAGEAGERFTACERRLPLVAKMEARFLLWQATGDRSHLEAAAGLLAALQGHAPAADREGLALRVPLYREIAAAAGTAGL
jgi:tetratricopeptide (TPR) repeat protein